MNFTQLIRRVNSEEEAVRFFQEYHILPTEMMCENGHQMTLSFGVKVRWRCSKRTCRVDKGIRMFNWLGGWTKTTKSAIMYNDRSVLENHHAAESWRLLMKSENKFIANLDAAEFKRFRYLVLEYILATDLKQHFDIILEFNDKLNNIELSNEAHRLIVSRLLIKFADINSPSKPHPLHRQWTERICREFYEQGDDEKRRHMQISPYMDRCKPAVAKLQDSFIAHMVNPLAVALNEAGLLPILPGLQEPEIIINLKHNHQKWLLEIEEESNATNENDEEINQENEANVLKKDSCLTQKSSSEDPTSARDRSQSLVNGPLKK